MEHNGMEYEKNGAGLLIPVNELRFGGRFEVTHMRKGKILSVEECKNLVVNQGLNHILDVSFHGSTAVSPWYVGLFEGNYTPVAGLTAATVASASTECTAYDESVRQEYTEAAAASQSITNSASRATFTFNATKTVYGAFLISDSTKSGTSGTLLAAARFSASKAVVDDDQLLVTYTFNASSV